MVDILWPASLPCFNVAGYQRGGGDDGVKRSQFPAGTKTWPRFTRPPALPITATMTCTSAQVQTVEDFWEITCQRTLPFLRQDDVKPDPTLVEYAWRGRPEVVPHQRLPNRWVVTLQLEMRGTFQGTFPLGAGGNSLLGDGSGDAIST